MYYIIPEKIIKDKNALVIYDYGLCWVLDDIRFSEILDNSFFYTNDDNLIDKQVNNVKDMCKICKDGEYLLDEDLINNLFNKKLSIHEYINNLTTYFKIKKKKLDNNLVNLLINFWLTNQYNDISLLDQLSLCDTYNIFRESRDIIDKQVKYSKCNIKSRNKIFNDLKKYI